MFGNKPAVIGGKSFALKKVEGLRRYDVGNILFIEQNSKKATPWGYLAREGHKIMWVIDKKWNDYIARVDNGKITNLKY